jgi:hypothetical protein
MKKCLLFVWFFVTTLVVHAQSRFGNEWIKPGQNYLKVSVNQPGIYRLGYADIKAADASFLLTNPAGWQLFFRGQEVAMRVVGQQDGVFDAQDYVEFYGEGNDGAQDSLLYRPQRRLHPYQTLFSDKSAYFLTSSPTLTGKRMPELNLSAQGLTPVPFHVEETVQAFTSEYTFNNLQGLEPLLQQSYFEPGEGWSGRLLTADSVGVVQLKLPRRASVNWPITLQGMVNGRDNSFHQIQIQPDATPTSPITPLSLLGFASQTFQAVINAASVQNDQLTVRFTSVKNAFTNNFSITYVKVTYPQLLDMAGQPSQVFHLPSINQQRTLMVISNVPPSTSAYDITDYTEPECFTDESGS